MPTKNNRWKLPTSLKKNLKPHTPDPKKESKVRPPPQYITSKRG